MPSVLVVANDPHKLAALKAVLARRLEASNLTVEPRAQRDSELRAAPLVVGPPSLGLLARRKVRPSFRTQLVGYEKLQGNTPNPRQ